RAGWRWRRPWGAARRWKRGVLLKGNKREHTVRHGKQIARIIRWIGIGPVPEIILEIVVDSKTGAHRPGPRTGRIPRDAHARLQQQFGMILSQAGMSQERFVRDYEVFVIHVVRNAVSHLVLHV